MTPLPPPSDEHKERGAGHTPAHGTIFPVSGIAPSCAEIRRVHHRVAHHDVPMPARSWIKSRTAKATITLPDRRPGEPMIRPEQILKIRSFSSEIDGKGVATLGEEQADCFIGAMTRLRREHSAVGDRSGLQPPQPSVQKPKIWKQMAGLPDRPLRHLGLGKDARGRPPVGIPPTTSLERHCLHKQLQF